MQDDFQENLGFNHKEVYDLAREDLDFFAGLALPDVTAYAYPPEFTTIWQIITELAYRVRDFSKVGIGYPRGFGKTSFVKLFILYCILYTDKRFPLVFGNTATLAENIIADIVDMLDEPNIKAVYGDWRVGLEIDRQEVKKFTFRGRTIILAALGQGGSVRGLNIKNARPDIMIFEDIQSREQADSQKVSRDIETWMTGTAMKAATHLGCLYLFIANMYPTEWSILKRLKKNPSWLKFIVGGILADGSSLWEQLKPIGQLLEEYESDLNAGYPEIFYSEVLNDETVGKNRLMDFSKLPAYPFDDDEIAAGKFIIIDPSNDKANSDAVSIGLFFVIDTKPVAIEIIEGRFSPGDTIIQALRLAVMSGVSCIVIEGNAYQYSLCYWFDVFIKMYQLSGIVAKPIYSGKRSKNSRILDMFKSLMAGQVLVHPRCWTPVKAQITAFDPLKGNNTDGILDLLTYAPRVLAEMPELLLVQDEVLHATVDSYLPVPVEENNAF